MSDKKTKVFADGFSFRRKANAPNWNIGRLSINITEAVPFLKQHHKDGWVNLLVNESKNGNLYVELDTFEPKKKNPDGSTEPGEQPPPKSYSEPSATEAEDDSDDLPF